jgi:hypothetical protein
MDRSRPESNKGCGWFLNFYGAHGFSIKINVFLPINANLVALIMLGLIFVNQFLPLVGFNYAMKQLFKKFL